MKNETIENRSDILINIFKNHFLLFQKYSYIENKIIIYYLQTSTVNVRKAESINCNASSNERHRTSLIFITWSPTFKPPLISAFPPGSI